ncbi:MAG: GlxA family transcriptional regulator [Rhizobiaceae bacterium]
MSPPTNPSSGNSYAGESHKDRGPVRLGVYLTQQFPLAPLSLVVDSLRVANGIVGKQLFTHVMLSSGDDPVISSCNFPAATTIRIDQCPPLDVLLVCLGDASFRFSERPVLQWLRRVYHSGAIVGGISSGSMLLAHAGLLDDRRCAVHWASVEAMKEHFHRVVVTGNIFCVDGRLITCAGGVSTLDMMLHLIERLSSSQIAFDVADALIYPSIRGDNEPARGSLIARTGVGNRQLNHAIELMETNIETPISITEISKRVDASVRHLERLFARFLEVSPTQYYMRIRLETADSLLAKTDLPIVEVALRCGFRNASHFTRRYSVAYEELPSIRRRAGR